jgi:hypothetical protein
MVAATLTYRVIRSINGIKRTEKVEASCLSWKDAKRKSEQLSEVERKAHPELTCWMRDIFCCEVEKFAAEEAQIEGER